MKTARVWMVIVLVSMLGFAVLSSNALAAQTTLRFAHISDENHPAHTGALKFAELVEEGTEGRVKVEIYPNSTLGSAPEYTEQIKLGTVDLGLSTSGQLQVWIKEYAAVMLPFAYDGYDHAHRALDGPAGAELAALAEEEGFKVLANWEWGFRQISNSRRPIQSAADLKGLKLRVPNEIQLQAMFETLGASTAIIAFPELYLALAQKVVDGQDNPLPTIYHQKFYEVQKYVAITNHVYNTQMLVMSQRAWNKLSQHDQEVVRNAAVDAGNLVRDLIQKEDQRLVGEMKKAGVVVTYPDIDSFRNAMAPAIERISKFAGEEFVERFLKYADDAR